MKGRQRVGDGEQQPQAWDLTGVGVGWSGWCFRRIKNEDCRLRTHFAKHLEREDIYVKEILQGLLRRVVKSQNRAQCT